MVATPTLKSLLEELLQVVTAADTDGTGSAARVSKPLAKAAASKSVRRNPKTGAPIEEFDEDDSNVEDEGDEEEAERDWTAEKWTNAKLTKLERPDLLACADAFGVEHTPKTRSATLVSSILDEQKVLNAPAPAKKTAAKPTPKKTPARRAAPVEDEDEDEEDKDDEELPEEDDETAEDETAEEGDEWTTEELLAKPLGELKLIAREYGVATKGLGKEEIVAAMFESLEAEDDE